MKRMLTFAVLLWSALAPVPSAAQPYDARRNGDIVQLEDRRTRTVVSIVTSVGNMAYEMTVNGQNVLRFPFATIADFKAKPMGMHGIPFLAPWANRLDEQAFYANGKRYGFDMQLGNVSGAVPMHGFMSRTDQWQVVEVNHDAKAAWVTSRLEAYKQPSWMKQWPFAHTIEMTYRLEGGVLEVRTKVTNHAVEPMPVSLGFHPYYQLTDSPREEWTITVPARTRWLLSYQKVPTGETEPTDAFFPGFKGALKDYNLDDVFTRPRAGRAGDCDGDASRDATSRLEDLAGAELQGAGDLLAQSAEHRTRQPDRSAEPERRNSDGAAERRGAAAGSGARARLGASCGKPPGHIQLRLLRADGGDHQRAQPGAQRRLQGAPVHRAGRNVAGELLDQAQRILNLTWRDSPP